MTERMETKINAQLADMTGLSTGQIIEKRIQCRHCGSQDYELVIVDEGVHYGKYICVECGEFIQWAPKPGEHKRKVKRLRPEITYCESCLKEQTDLPQNCTLEEHHVLPFKTNPELDETPSNRWVLCTDCHDFIDLIRRIAKRRETDG